MDTEPNVRVIGPDDGLDDATNPGPDAGNRLPESRIEERDDATQRTDDGISGVKNFAGFPLVSPIDLGDGNRSNEPRPTEFRSGRRGRPLGSKNRTTAERNTQTPPPNNLENIEELLVSLHFMGAKLLDVPEIELTQDESRKLMKAVKDVAKYYNVAFDPKKLAIFHLMTAMGGIYGPRAVAIYRRKTAGPKKEPGKLINIDRSKTGPQATPSPAPKTDATKPIDLSQLTPSQLWNENGESEQFAT